MDVNKLLKALDDESNENLLNFTSKKILEISRNLIFGLLFLHLFIRCHK